MVLLIRGRHVVTMNGARDVLRDGAVLVVDDRIAAVGAYAELAATHPAATVVGTADSLVTPGYVNAHQHLTGDRLVRSCIPDAITSQEAIFDWAVPVGLPASGPGHHGRRTPRRTAPARWPPGAGVRQRELG